MENETFFIPHSDQDRSMYASLLSSDDSDIHGIVFNYLHQEVMFVGVFTCLCFCLFVCLSVYVHVIFKSNEWTFLKC